MCLSLHYCYWICNASEPHFPSWCCGGFERLEGGGCGVKCKFRRRANREGSHGRAERDGLLTRGKDRTPGGQEPRLRMSYHALGKRWSNGPRCGSLPAVDNGYAPTEAAAETQLRRLKLYSGASLLKGSGRTTRREVFGSRRDPKLQSIEHLPEKRVAGSRMDRITGVKFA